MALEDPGTAEVKRPSASESPPRPRTISEYPRAYKRDSGLVVLPDHGTLHVISDLHGNDHRFFQWYVGEGMERRLRSEPDFHLGLLGDVVDDKNWDRPITTVADFAQHHDGDVALVAKAMELAHEFPEQFFYLSGTHEREVIDIWQRLNLSGMPPEERASLILAYYEARPHGMQHNYVQRATDEAMQFLAKLPVAFVTHTGIVGVHAGPSQKAESLVDIAGKLDDVVYELVWARPHIPGHKDEVFHKTPRNPSVRTTVFDPDHVDEFLGRIGGKILVCGHTAVSDLRNPNGTADWYPNASAQGEYGLLGDNVLVVDSGSMLKIDLGKTYRNADELLVDQLR